MIITKKQYKQLLKYKKEADQLSKKLEKIDKGAQKILKTEDADGYLVDYFYNGYDISHVISGLGVKVE